MLSIYEWCAIPLILGSSVGAIIYGTFVIIPGPVKVAPTALGLWFAALTIFFSFMLVFHVRWKYGKTKLSTFYHFLATAIYLVIGICYTFGGRLDAAAWAAAGIFVNLATLHYFFKVHIKAELPELKTGLVNENELIEKHTRPHVVLSYTIGFVATLVLLLLGLFMGGAIIQAQSYGFLIDGQRVVIPINDTSNHTLKIRYLCKGPNNTGPTFIIDSDGAHAAADFYGLQDLIADRGRRSCIFDKPGLGWSDYYYASQNMDEMTWYHQLLTAIHEKPPFILVGWGGGGPTIWKYSNLHPEMVAGIGYLDTYGDGIEWRAVQYMKSLTNEELLELRKEDIAGRNRLFALIRALGVPWGIINFLLPTDPSSFYPSEKWTEYHWYYITAKTWTTQYFALQQMAKARLERYWLGAFNETNPRLFGIPVVHILSYLSDIDVCKQSNLTWGSKECKYAIGTNAFMKKEQMTITYLTGNGTVVKCTELSCNQAFPVTKANWTAHALVTSFPY